MTHITHKQRVRTFERSHLCEELSYTFKHFATYISSSSFFIFPLQLEMINSNQLDYKLQSPPCGPNTNRLYVQVNESDKNAKKKLLH